MSRSEQRWCATTITALTIGLALAPSCAGADPQPIAPFQVIDHALARWRDRPRPITLSYLVEFTGHSKDHLFRRLIHVDDRVADHIAHVTVLDSEGTAPPFVEPEKPRLLPTETFGFVPIETTSARPAPVPAAGSPPVIASVHATIRYPYDVSFVGIETIGDRSAYHLQLEPRQARDDYPLRELWVDASTYDVLQVVAQQFAHVGPIAIPYRVSAQYAEQGPYWLISHAEAGATIHAGLFSYGSNAHADYKDFRYDP
jgi:hypothetical protein